jgi:hypothetical protein
MRVSVSVVQVLASSIWPAQSPVSLIILGSLSASLYIGQVRLRMLVNTAETKAALRSHIAAVVSECHTDYGLGFTTDQRPWVVVL